MKIQPKPFIDRFKLRNKSYGVERRRNMSKIILEHGTPFPLSVEYEDIDKEFQRWVDEDLRISYDNITLPTFKLFSNQRISEYAQTWKHLDENGNILMNFKTVTREIDPQQGQSQGGYYNIHGNRDYPMFYVPVLQENGQEAYDLYSMKQPYAVDFSYTVGIITNKYELINQFNQLIQDKFKSLQCYISPNGHNMPLVLDNITDESEYALEDRKYYSQKYRIKLKAYIIKKEDFIVTRIPSRITFGAEGNDYKRPKIKIEDEYIDPCRPKDDNKFYNKEIIITINFPMCTKECKFIIDTDIIIEDIELTNVYDFVICANDEKVDLEMDEPRLYDGDNVYVMIERDDLMKDAVMVIRGYDPNSILDSTYNPESSLDEAITEEEIIINA